MKKITMFSIVLLMAMMTVIGAMTGKVSAASTEVIPVSSGLKVIAAQSDMGKYGVSGGEIAFSPEDFERALNSKRVDYITFTELPDEALGVLMLGSDGISKGQTVSRENIHKLSYVPKGEGISENKFVFTTGKGYDIECSVYMLENINCSPVAGVSGELSLSVSTHRNVSVWGSLSGYDSDGDEIKYEIVSYPSNGILYLTDVLNGEFKYTPSSDYTGKDSFRYVVVDKYGNYSAASEVSLDIDKVKLDSVLSDMGGNRAHSSAITMIEKNLMKAGTDKNGKAVFSPEGKVTREEFLVMVMKAVGISEPTSQNIGFADDSDISDFAKGYVGFAKEKGYIKGTQQGGSYYFYPKKTITVAEASVIVDNIIGGARYVVNDKGVLSVFDDHNDVPTWAKDSMQTLKCVGIISGNSGYLYPQKEMTRESAALMINAVIRLTDSELK